MRDVGEGEGAYFVGDLFELLPIEVARIGGKAGDDHFWFVFVGEAANLVHVDAAGFFVYLVLDEVVSFARKGDWEAVSDVSAVV